MCAVLTATAVVAVVAYTVVRDGPAPPAAQAAPLAPIPQKRPTVVEPAAGGFATPAPKRSRRKRKRLSVERAVGRKIMTAIAGGTPTPQLLRRVRRGEVGGILLNADDVTPRLRANIALLQRTARAGGNPRLLVAVDQEGGRMRPVPGPPATAAALTPPRDAARSGKATGKLLRGLGITVDLAPVADVERGGFLRDRAFGTEPKRVSAAACRFARGLERARVRSTFKHFPGIGRATGNADLWRVTIPATRAELKADLRAYRDCAPSLVMLSNAVYPALDPAQPAVFSRRVIGGLLRRDLRFRGVTISDTLNAPSVGSPQSAVRAAAAGVDVLVYTKDASSVAAYASLLAAARAGELRPSALRASAARIDALKR